MAGDGEDETEYESDPEEAKMSLKMRRREASDDEEEQQQESESDGEVSHPRAGIDSEGESDGQGAAAEYDEEVEEDEGEGYYDEAEEEVGEGEGAYEEREIRSGGEAEGEVEGGKVVREKVVEERVGGSEENGESQGQGKEEEKKENDPFAVPTSGAFYMHDDRFRDNAGGRHSRTFGGQKLWESKDDRKWGHDKFEEMSMKDRSYDEGRRSSKGYHRGRGKGRGVDRGYAQGNRMRGLGVSSNQNAAPKDVRGRGPRRYQPSMKNKNETLPPQNKQSTKFLDRSSNPGFRKNAASAATSNEENETVPAKKVASNLSSASPPFYPSVSSNKETTLAAKKEAQDGSNSRNLHPSAMEHNFSMRHTHSSLRGKNVNNSIAMDKLHIDDSVSPASAKSLNNVHLPSAVSSSSSSQMPQSRTQGRVAPSTSSVFQPPQTNNQVSRVIPPAAQALSQNFGQDRGQPSLQASGQQLSQRSLGSSQGSSPPKAGKGAGRGSLVYGGTQVMGSGGSTGAGDSNLPAFFPVMPFGGQHPGGVGVPAVGMAFPGYVAQPNGLGKSEMTWLPVLANAAAALGTTYCPPYLTVDGSYHPRPTSALPGPSKESNPNNELKPQQRSEVSNDEFSQRQNKPRRYSEMKFSQ